MFYNRIRRLIVILFVCAAAPLAALDLEADAPIEITAMSGITCERDKNRCFAEGSVVVRHKDYILTCDRLMAFFAGDANDRQDLSVLEARGNVEMRSSKEHQQAFADIVTYDVKAGFATLRGQDLRVLNGDTIVTAKDRIEISQKDGSATAYECARVRREEKMIEADKLTLFMTKGDHSEVDRVEGEGHVALSTPDDLAVGDHAIYHHATHEATLEGNVSITRADGYLEGARAVVNLEKKEARILPNIKDTPTTKPQRVRVLILPKSRKTGHK